MRQRAWRDLRPGDQVLGRNAGVVQDTGPAPNGGTGLLVRYQDGRARIAPDPDELVCVRAAQEEQT